MGTFKAGGPVAFLLMVMFAYCAIPAMNDFFLFIFYFFCNVKWERGRCLFIDTTPIHKSKLHHRASDDVIRGYIPHTAGFNFGTRVMWHLLH